MPASLRNINLGKKLQQDLKFTEDDLRYAAERQRDRIVKRTGQGIDANGVPFQAYTPAYKKRKEKTGRDSGIVDLNWSGRMLKALKVNRVSANGAKSNFVLGIYGDEGVRAAAIDEGNGKMPKRNFVGANQQDRILIVNDIKARMIARAEGGGLNVGA
jgi:hypothetical protein